MVLIDRTLDLAAPASHGGSLLQKVRYSITTRGGMFCTGVEVERGRVHMSGLSWAHMSGIVFFHFVECLVLLWKGY